MCKDTNRSDDETDDKLTGMNTLLVFSYLYLHSHFGLLLVLDQLRVKVARQGAGGPAPSCFWVTCYQRRVLSVTSGDFTHFQHTLRAHLC